MFTGIVEEIGKIQKITSNAVTIKCETVIENTKNGDSIAVNGVCLTVTAVSSNSFTADISPETFSVTALKTLEEGSFVNLERAMRADGRFGGHIVSGHIDGCGKIVSVSKQGNFYDFVIELEPEQAKYAVKKGSIAINGISLTIADMNKNRLNLAVIPHTYEYTSLKYLRNGDIVNIETDMLAKYVEKFLSTGDNRSRINLEFLQEHGF